MTSTTVALGTKLFVEPCIDCGIVFAVPEGYNNARREDHRTFYCPNGHNLHYPQESNAEKFQRLYHEAEKRAGRNYDRAEATERSLVATKGHVTRLRKKVLAGECPFCGQHLRDLERHISRQHPDAPSDEATA